MELPDLLMLAGTGPGEDQGDRGLKRKAEEAVGPSEGRAEAANKRSGTLAAVTACAAGRIEAQRQGASAVGGAGAATASASGSPTAVQPGSDNGAPVEEAAPSSLQNVSSNAQAAATAPGDLSQQLQ